MKKIITFSAALILGVCAFGATRNVRAANATLDDGQAAALKSLLEGYNDGGYTKKTQMYLTDGCVTEMAAYFHAGATTLKRATYYNSTETALLMGNYDGTFNGVGGATGINSGYRNKGEGVEHFRYEDTSADEANLFAEGKTVADWTAAGQTVGGYYQTLTSLANSIEAADWVYSDGAYIHDIKDLHVTDGEYDDPILKKFQYFAAPMMLQNAYISWHTIRIVEGASFLSIRLYTTAADGDGKSTLIGESEALISEARVYKGIKLSPEVTWTLKGSFDSWGDGEDLHYQADLYVPEQYSITKTLSAGAKFKLFSHQVSDIWLGYSAIENQDWVTDDSDDAVTKGAGEYTFYLKPKTSKIYIVSDATVTIPLNISSWGTSDATFYGWVWSDTVAGRWIRVADGNGSITIPANMTKIIMARMDPENAKTPDWDATWNQSQDLTVELNKKLEFSGNWDYYVGDKKKSLFNWVAL